MLKKLLCTILILLMVFASVACATPEETNGDASEAPSYGNVNLVIGTGGVAGTWYPVGGVIASVMSNAPNITVTAQTAAAGVENIRLVSNGERDLGMASPNLIAYAQEGVEAFKGEKIDNIRSIAMMMPMAGHWVIRADAGIKSIADLKGKSVGTGAPGSGDEVVTRQIMELAGITYDDIDEQLLSFSEQVTAFKDRQLDSMFMMASVPTSSVLDAASQADCALLPVEGDFLDLVLETYPYCYATSISPADYGFLKEEVPTVGLGTCFFTSADLDEEIVYEITKAMFEGIETIQGAHKVMEAFTIETASEGLSVKLHPGALRYYEEMGIEIDESLK